MIADAGERGDGFQRAQLNNAIDFTAKLISSGIFIGYVPLAPGTFGSLLAIVFYLFLPEYIVNRIWIFLPVLYFLGVWTATHCEEFWGKDNRRIVIDEIVGMFVTLVFLPVNVKILCLGFFLFRAFDIVKPPPIRFLERLPRGWGVMTDDLMAGVYTNLVLRLIIYFSLWVS